MIKDVFFRALHKAAPLIKPLYDWLASGQEHARESLGRRGMPTALRSKALKDLSSKTSTRSGANGTEYLMHRSLSDDEAHNRLDSETRASMYMSRGDHRMIGGKKFTPFTSWSTGITVPTPFDHIVSAWIPEKHISFVPKVYAGKIDNAYTRKLASEEGEAIVSPGVFRVHHHTPVGIDFSTATEDVATKKRKEAVARHQKALEGSPMHTVVINSK